MQVYKASDVKYAQIYNNLLREFVFFQAQQTPPLLWGVFNRLYPNVHQGISSSSMDYSWFFPVITGTEIVFFPIKHKNP